MNVRRSVHVFVAALLVTMLSGALIPTAGAQGSPEGLLSFKSNCENILVEAGWGRIGLPNFGSGEQRVISYSVDAWNKKRLFVTNGLEVYRTMDGGCSWKKVYELPEQPTAETDYSALDSRIDQVVIPEGTTADKIVYFVLDQYRAPQGVARGNRTRVFRSENNGKDWVEADGEVPDSLPPHGSPELLLPSPSFPKVLYLLMESPDLQYMATSPDGGKTWKTTGPLCVAPVLPDQIDTPVESVEGVPGAGCVDPDEGTTNAPAPADTTGIAIDPFQPHDLWYYGPRGLERSLNSGKSPKTVQEVAAPIAAVDIFRVAGQDSRIIAAGATAPALHVSEDGGRTWEVQGAPGFVESIAKGRTAQEYALATDAGVFLSIYGAHIAVGPTDRRSIGGIQSARTLGGTGGLCFFGSSGSHLEVACMPEYLEPPPPPPPPDVEIEVGDLINTKAARFIPDGFEVALDRGESRVESYKLRLFKSPTPLDVYFLIDISGSMQNTIDGVAHGMQDIINELTRSKINTHFGVGVYRAYDDGPPYARRLDISPPGEELEKTLENLIANGGGDETQLAALYQTATGEGQDVDLVVRDAHIPEGQQANFREEALKVVIHATDEKFSTLPPHPSFDQVTTALNENNIEQVGLAIQEPGAGGSANEPEALQTAPRSGLLRVAEGTQTWAVEPVDCDGDGVPDIAAGHPLVCDIDPDKAYRSALMSAAIVQLLNSVEDIGEVQVNVEAPPGVVPNIESKLFTGVDFKDPPDLDFDVMFTCPVSSDRARFEVKFNAVAKGFLLAETTATVRCRDEIVEVVPPASKEPKRPVELETLPSFLPIPAFVPPFIRPPEVSPNPGPNTQTQPQAQSQGQMQSAMAKQKQEQVQLALAYSKGLKAELAAERAGEDMNMSKYRSTSQRRREQTPPGLALMLSASAMSLAFGLAAKRYRTQIAAAPRRRRFR